MPADIEELKQRIIHGLDVMEFLDIIGYNLADLVNLLEEEIEEYHTQLSRAC
jgi:hypothetical protein